jgi:ubiquinone/menaquinone biosynthesis C-methylase UbiE/diadenosine tetraphosphate (Ap4A) HIT family hydrolase
MGMDPIASTLRAYESIAKHYAAHWFDDRAMDAALDRFLRLLPEKGTVLDAGCGPGRDVKAMQQRGVEAVGIDTSPAMLREARERVSDAVFRKMTITKVHYPPNTYIGVWACAVLQHLPLRQAEEALREFARILQPGGVLFATIEIGKGEETDEYGRYRRFYSPEEFRALLKVCGFKVLLEETVPREKSTLPTPRPKTWFVVMARRDHEGWDGFYCQSSYACELCLEDRFLLNRDLKNPEVASILWGSDDSYLLPDIAPLMEGHLLLMTTKHHTCYGACSASLLDHILGEQERVRVLFRTAYDKDTIFLEHGPAKPNEAGSCIDHAHFHCMPSSIPIREEVERLVGPGQRCGLHDLQGFYSRGQSYLFVQGSERTGHAYQLTVAPLQFLRQVTASLIGNIEWRWRSSCRLDETREAFKQTLVHLLPVADDLLCESGRELRL